MIETLLALPSDLPADHVRKLIPEGYQGTLATVEEMRKCVDQGKRDFRIRKLAGQIIQNVPNKDYAGYAKAIHNWIMGNIKYAFDPAGVETIEWPSKILESKVADCDSSAILNAALLESIGIEARFRAIKANDANKDEFSHIWVEAYIPQKGWMASDCTMPNGFGWRPPDHYGAMNWPASHDKYENHEGDKMAGIRLAGLGAASYMDQQTATQVIEGIFDGTERDMLVGWQADLDRQTKETNALSAAAAKMTDASLQAQALANIATLRNSIGNARLQFVQARNNYDQVVGELNRLGFSLQPIQSGFNGLSGLGSQFGTLGFVLPAVVTEGIVMGGILVAAAVALSLAAGGISDAIRGNDGIITQTKKLIESTGVAVSSTVSSLSWLLVAAGIGLAGWVGYKYLAKRGKI